MASNVPDALHSGRSGNIEDAPAETALAVALPEDSEQRIAKNATYLTAALLVQKVLTFGYFIYINRSLSTEDFGNYFSALTIATVFGYFVDVAFSQVLIREVAKRQEHTTRYLNAAISLKLLVAIFVYAAALLYVLLFGYPALARSLVYLTGIIMVLDSFTLTFYAVFRGHQKLQYEAAGTVINVLLKVAIGGIGLFLGFGVYVVVVAILVASTFNFLFSALLVVRKLPWRPQFAWDGSTLAFLAKIAVPFAIAGIFQTVYTNQDQLLLANPALVGAKGPGFVAWYGTAYKYAFALSFIPAAIAAAIFPAMSAYHVRSKELLASTFERAMSYLLLIGIPISFGILALADTIIKTVSTHVFWPSILPLQILSASVLFLFLNYPVGYLLNATDRQTRNTIHVGIATVFNLILNLVLIPAEGFLGAAIASVLSSALLLVLGLSVVPQIIAYRRAFLLKTAARAVFAAGTMAALIVEFKGSIALHWLFLVGVAWYVITLYAVGGFTIEDARRAFRFLRLHR